METLTDLSRQRDNLCRTLLTEQAKLEALKYDPMINVTVSEEELRSQTTVQAYENIQFEISNVEEKKLRLS